MASRIPFGMSDWTDESPDAQERRLLCDLLDKLGPSARTLLDGWATRDLAAHLVVRRTRLGM